MTTTSTGGDKGIQAKHSSSSSATQLEKSTQASSSNKNTTIGKTVLVKGNLKANDGDTLINGRIDGSIELKRSRVEVGVDAHIDANVHAKAIIVNGELKGDLYASEQIIIKKTGRVFGNVYATDVTIEDGALLKGRIHNEARDHTTRVQHTVAPEHYEDHDDNISLSSIFKKVQEITHLHLHHPIDGYNSVWVLPRNDAIPQKRKEGVLYLQKTSDGIIRVYNAVDKEPKILNQRECDSLAKLELNFIGNKLHKLDDNELIEAVISICGYVHAVSKVDGELLVADGDETNSELNALPSPESMSNQSGVFSDKSVIGQGILIEGELFSDEDVEYRGQLTGMVYFKNNKLDVTADAHIKANIFVKELVSGGEIQGDVCASDLVNIKKAGRLYGNVLSPRVIIESGAVVMGSVEMEQKHIEKVLTNLAQNFTSKIENAAIKNPSWNQDIAETRASNKKADVVI